jgi:hypothetical protein
MRRGNLGDGAGNTSNESLVAFRGALHPMGAMADGDRRVLDVGVGYVAEGSSGQDNANGTKAVTLQGPYLEVSAYPLRVPIGEKYGLRMGATSSVEALFREGSSNAGVGLTVGPALEFTGNASGPFASEDDDGGVTVGQASGYWAVGLFANGSVRKFDEHYSSAFTGGISFRIPFAFGVACCAVPHFGSDDHSGRAISAGPSSSSSSSHSSRRRADPKPGR